MYKIYKTVLCSPVDYAAEELKKYLRMMMPMCGEVEIGYDPEAKEGFRLCLMQDLGLDVSDAEDTALDDILFIDADDRGGIIAGDNPRSVLLAVYEYLRQQGCRWLFPGSDGEFIPMVEGLKPIKYRHKPSCRYRGQCNEGAEYQDNMIEAIEFTPKIGLNIFMLEFKIPSVYYKRYYNHMHNQDNRPPEPVSYETILQWKRECEAEIAKRGLEFHDMGHGWSADPFGIDSAKRCDDGYTEEELVSEEARKYLALRNGERNLVHGIPNHTQFCMSNDEARNKVVRYIADYSERSSNVDFMHVWLGDAFNNHCECEACQKKTPSDWYVIMLNELDAELTRRKLGTKIVFIAYTDTMWAPLEEKIKNQSRFTLLFAPISRSYVKSLEISAEGCKTSPYVRNANVPPRDIGTCFAYLDEWKKMWKGDILSYEYHFWYHQYFDVGGTAISKVINDDIKAYKANSVNGVIQDGSQRSFFPTGLAFYTYARSMYDISLSYEEIEEEYFSCAFGEDWRDFRDYLDTLGRTFDNKYLEGQASSDINRSPYYNPDHVEDLKRVREITAKGRELIEAHYNMPYRIQTASVRILERHAKFAELFADALIPKALGDDDRADELRYKMASEMGKEEAYMERCYDHGLAFYAINRIFSKKTQSIIY
ncbi:MAG: DUF4838 domain-containing protein [Ruminococcaceae bacterium]|nr:DUF4838 domain-containing protein [Oscillospiraceae bacterium]